MMNRDDFINTRPGHSSNWSSRLMCFAIIVTACLLATYSQSDEKKLPIEGGEVFKIGERTAFLILPKKGKSNDPIPWVWYAPMLKGLPGVEEKWMFEQFLANGIAIAGVDVGESYGNPKGRRVYSALYKELTEKRGLTQEACLLARSRGGLMLYNWAAENPRFVACIAGIYPVCNLSSYPGLDRACGAYDMSKEQLAAKLVEHNPIDRLAPLAKAKVPIFHIHGDSDSVVPLDKNSALVKERYELLGGEMELEIVKGQGHNMWSGWFNSQRLLDFVIAHGKDGIVTVVGTKKFHFISDTTWLLGQGFEIIENISSGFSLISIVFHKNAKGPYIHNSVKSGECPHKEGLVAYFSYRCPYSEYHVRESLLETANKRHLPLKVIKLATMEEAQSAPTPATIFNLFPDGKFVTTDISVCMDSRFDKIICKK